VRGRTLDQLLSDRARFSAEEAAAIGIEICQAVAAVHAAGLLHRDIKAPNVMRADDGRIVLMDFGTGRDADDTGASDLTGTPLYLAPEVLAGAPATRQSDIYSIGVLLYHLVTGAYPVRGASVAELRRAHERGARVALREARPDLPARLTRAIDRAIDPRPDRRHESVASLGAALQTARRWPRRRWLQIAAAMGVLLAGAWWGTRGTRSTPAPILAADERPLIAVLPFRNDGAAETDLFVEGLTYEIRRRLSAIGGIRVTSGAALTATDRVNQGSNLAGPPAPSFVLEGSVLRSGDALRVHAELVRADGNVLWRDKFDRRFADVFAIQDDISRAIVTELKLTLGPEPRRYVTHPQAYEPYLRARALMQRAGPGALEVIRLLEEAIAADPGYAPAHAALASAIAKRTYAFPNPDPTNVPPDVANATIRPAAMRAIELDPLLAEAHAAMGIVHSSALDWTGAVLAFRRALQLDPGQTSVYADFVLSTLWPLGRVEESRDWLAHAVELDPQSPFLWRLYARMQVLTHAPADALESLERVVELDPAFGLGFQRVEALVFAGRIPEAIALMEAGGEGLLGVLGYAYAVSGRRSDAAALAARSADFPQRQVMIFAGLGDADRTFEALDRLAAINARRALCYTTYPELAALRGDPRMAAFRLRYGVR
jgi:serine/threonine-protein kinase